ncbi:hypothetical protein [Lapillicoccus jejuensis]|uniref:Cytochrome P450 n=1 Tax=Lapillicoccus jejuensis TaxID=402171 RepID=A0A542E5Y1_9MICO|nr:hypothetical protein [Lapillicoccus jejuensis]TQJ10704.1 hypothetical protein FB458_3838 [Lapillicoccus jejuensis]
MPFAPRAAARAARAAHRAVRTDFALLLAVRGYEGMAAAWRHDPEATALPMRFLGKPAALVRGADGARTFYDTNLFARTGAVPAIIARPLFGRGAVHGLDGDPHRFRKAVFLEVLNHSSVAALAQVTAAQWRRTVSSWEAGSRHDVFTEAVAALGRGAFEWSGSAVRPDDVDAWSVAG